MPFLWVAIALIVLVLLQRWIHTHLHGLSLLLTGKPDTACTDRPASPALCSAC